MNNNLSPVEKQFLDGSPFKDYFPKSEKITTVVADNFPALGKLAAMRFVEWVQQNPGGVISLPTGKTPEHFIKWVMHLLQNWRHPDVQKELEKCGVDPASPPNMKSLHFAQIDEFYPIDPKQHNSFYHYVNHFYINGFGLDLAKAMVIDCSKIGLSKGQSLATVWPDSEVDLSLRYLQPVTAQQRVQKTVLERIDQWCQEYEENIRLLGGIGFFLGGIGPDGHIGFNVRGSDHFSTTRLTATNYETQAAAATDLGGIEVSRKRLVITIGLGTITYNPNCTAIIIAAGEARAEIVASAVQEKKNVLYPATALQGLPNARFYLTLGAAQQLEERRYRLVSRSDVMSNAEKETIVIDLALKRNKRLLDLTPEDFANDRYAALLLEKLPDMEAIIVAKRVHDCLVRKIEKGAHTLTDTCFLHAEPHHDDLMLGYLPYIVRHVRDASNTHYFACLTSGFTAVTNRYVQRLLENVMHHIDTQAFAALQREDYFAPNNAAGRNRDVWQYLDGIAEQNQHAADEGNARRVLRNLITLFGNNDVSYLKAKIAELIKYFSTAYPGKKDDEQIQILKGMCREWEAECLWGYFGWNCENVLHLRLGFYKGDIFTEEPTFNRDVLPVLKMLQKVKPDVVSVAFDPEASGPDTHYKVLQAISEGLKRYEQEAKRADIKVWGYRNVWYRFHPAEAGIFVPVSLNMLSIMQSAFMNTFISQKEASFPSYAHNGPFSELAQRIQVEQYRKIKTCLGREWFYEHPSPLIRATRGLVYLKEMSLSEFYTHSRKLKQMAEAGDDMQSKFKIS